MQLDKKENLFVQIDKSTTGYKKQRAEMFLIAAPVLNLCWQLNQMWRHDLESILILQKSSVLSVHLLPPLYSEAVYELLSKTYNKKAKESKE